MSDITSYLTPEGTPERCGVILKDGSLLELTNIHAEPLLGFRVDPSEIIEHFDNADATWHTHPGADPNLSEADYAGFLQWPELAHLIVGVREGLPMILRFEVQDGVLVSV